MIRTLSRDVHVACAQKLCGDWDPLNLGGFVCPFSHVSEASFFFTQSEVTITVATTVQRNHSCLADHCTQEARESCCCDHGSMLEVLATCSILVDD